MRDSIVNDNFAHLLQPDTLLPSQYSAMMKRKSAHEPERRLAVAVLEDAIDCFRKHLDSRDPKAQQLFVEAEEWICSADRSWPFSFENVCDLLDMNPEYLRRGLIAWKDRQAHQHPRGKVVSLKPFAACQEDEQPNSLQQVNAG